MSTWIRVGIAFFLVFFGWHLYTTMGGWFLENPRDMDLRSTIGAMLLAIGLTLLWRQWVALRK